VIPHAKSLFTCSRFANSPILSLLSWKISEQIYSVFSSIIDACCVLAVRLQPLLSVFVHQLIHALLPHNFAKNFFNSEIYSLKSVTVHCLSLAYVVSRAAKLRPPEVHDNWKIV
jgi:hypothetical protein